ncbi:MAG: glycosyltransferase [Acidimicrobiales bacterium]|nr:glycosyltransferase [Acidimicrobiales bacterium]
MSGPTVSVALCTYQGERWLPDFLDGIRAQTRPPDELVVSDDGSTDATRALVEAFAGDAPFPVRRSTTPRRLGSTFNFAEAFGRCAGDLIAPADQDDVWAPAKLERLVEEMTRRDLDVAFSDGGVIDDEGRALPTSLWAGVGFDAGEQRAFARDPLGLLLRRSVVTGAAMMFRAAHLPRLLPFPEALNGEASLMLQDRWIAIVLAAVGRVGTVPDPLIDFRRHAGQQTGLRDPLTGAEVAHQLRRTTQSSAAGLLTRADQLDAVLERVGSDGHDGATERIAAAVAHLRRRAALPGPRPARVPAVLGEWLGGRYRRYSGGLRSAVADLARPADRPGAG